MTVFCPACSQPLSATASRCPRCGIELLPSPGNTASLGDEDHTTRTPRKGLDFAPGHMFAGRFTIIETAGSGGMGVVYKAIDNVLGHVVALKLIQSQPAASAVDIVRFKREARLTRQITHANVCRIHDLGESDGMLFISMEWISGETLRQLLRKTPLLREERALQIAETIALALDAAHAHGIVHRDLKPENVMIDDRGEIHVLDFGLAIEQGGDQITGALALMGTPGYMSPEQRGKQPLDARSDVYSLGLLLREMVTGETPGAASKKKREFGEGVSRAVIPLLDSLLAEDRERRCPSARAAADQIRQVRLRRAPEAAGSRLKKPVLWGAGLMVLGAVLLAVPYLRPKPTPTPAEGFYQRGLELREMAENERTIDDAIQMYRRALDADPNFPQAWAALGEAYWKRFGWNRQSSSREEAVVAVEKAFQLDQDLPEAHFAKATGLFAEGDYRSARAELELAVAAKPELDPAWALLGRADGNLGDYQQGRKALDRALSLKPDSFRHYLALGLFLDKSGEYDEAGRAYRKATELKPDSTMAWNSLGTACLRIKNFPGAVEAFDHSIKIEKRAINLSNLGTAHYFLKNYDAAAESYRAATQIDPANWGTWGNLGDSLKMLGRQDEAKQAYMEASRLARERITSNPSDASAHGALGLYCARAHDPGCDALAEGRKADQMRPGDVEITFRNAIIRCLLGLQDEALDLLEKAVKLGLSRAEIENDPDLPSLIGNPRYTKSLELAS